MDKICLNGRIMEAGEARISVLDYGMLYGYGLFETMRAYSGVVFRLEDHLERMAGSAEEMGIILNDILPEMEDSIYRTLEANKRRDAYVRLTVTYGVGKPRMNLTGKTKPNYFVITDELPDFSEQYEKGVRLMVSETLRQSSRSLTPRMKTLNYLDRIMAKKQAAEKGFYDALFLDEEGFVAEAATSTILKIKGDVLTTPSKDSILPGITRKLVMEIARQEGLKTTEEKIDLEKLLETDEIMLTNTIAEIIPVTKIDYMTIGNGRPGETTKKIHEKYKKKVREYVEKLQNQGGR